MSAVGKILRALGLTVGLVLPVLLSSGAVARADGPLIGVVKKLDGTVSLIRSGAPRPLSIGSDVMLHDRLRTGPDGAVGVTLGDGTLISLGPNSLFEFSEYQYAPQNDLFGFLGSLFGGTLMYTSGKIGKLAPDRTHIKTPLSVVSVRGTRFGVRLPAATGE